MNIFQTRLVDLLLSMSRTEILNNTLLNNTLDYFDYFQIYCVCIIECIYCVHLLCVHYCVHLWCVHYCVCIIMHTNKNNQCFVTDNRKIDCKRENEKKAICKKPSIK